MNCFQLVPSNSTCAATAWSASRHVLFLGLNMTNLATTAAALADGAIEALGGFAEGALVSLVAAPAAAALTAAAFEAGAYTRPLLSST